MFPSGGAIIGQHSDPSRPLNGKAVATSTSVTLTWTDPASSDLAAIVILRNTGGGTLPSSDPYATIMKGVQTFSDTNIKAGEIYKYLIRSRNNSGATDLNDTLITVIVPAPLVVAEEKPKTEVKKEESVAIKKEDTVAPKKEDGVIEKKISDVTAVEAPPATLRDETKTILSESTETIAKSVGRIADAVVEQGVKNTEKFTAIIGTTTETQTTAMVGFIAYGTQATATLGEGERAGVLDSYRRAYGALPATEEEWQDALRIGAGQLPDHNNASAETKATALFEKIYKRPAKAVDPSESVLKAQDGNDYDALRMAAYGIRPETRDLTKERTGIGRFKGTFGRDPKSAEDWDAVRMIAYSGVAPP